MSRSTAPNHQAAVGLLTALAILIVTASPGPVQSAEPVTVVLRPRVVLGKRLVNIQSVAELRGGNPQLRERMGALDLVDLTSGRGTAVITQRQIRFRLRLGAIPEQMVRVTGADESFVSLQLRAISPDQVVTAARDALLQAVPWKPEQLIVELPQPISIPMPAVAEEDQAAIKAELHPGSRPPGRVQMDVQILIDGRLRLALAVYFNVKICQQVVVCLQRVEKGEKLSDANVRLDWRPVVSTSRETLPCTDLVEKRALRALLPGQVVLCSDVEAPKPTQEVILVHYQQPVKMLLTSGALKVEVSGLAMQDGKEGQLIQIQNLSSKKIVVGRVSGPSQVTIE